MERLEGVCMMCSRFPIEIRHINLYLAGSEGFYCCKDCENELLEFIRKKSRESVRKKKEIFKNLKKKRGEIE